MMSALLFPDELRRPHVSHNSGNNEWYTPREYIEAARSVMGSIDLDPASSEKANEVVKAGTFYTKDDDGLRRQWHGRVWMNPPYANGLVGKFASKFAFHVDRGDIVQGIVLVNNATETAWFAEIVTVASALVFPGERVRFWRPNGKTGTPLQGQAILYAGTNTDSFLDTFQRFGWGSLVKKSSNTVDYLQPTLVAV